MEKVLKRLPDNVRAVIARGRDVSAETGMKSFLVGGFVRDLVMGVENCDVDIAVEGPAIEFAGRFGTGPGGRMVAHSRFGTATLEAGGLKVDFATTRREIYPQPAALPVVSPGTLRDDLSRRDFTINTLAIALAPAEFGALIDMYDGREDIAAGIIRVLHDKSFIDDPTRILRAVRFEQRLRFRIEPHTLRLLKEAARAGMLSRTEPQRLRDELLLIMKEKRPELALTRLQKLAGLGFVNPQLPQAVNWTRLFARVREESRRLSQECSSCEPPDLRAVYLSSLFMGMTRDAALAAVRKFAFSKNESAKVLASVSAGAGARRLLSRSGISAAAVFRLLDPLPCEALVLIAATSPVAVRRRISEFLKGCRGTRVCISGHDLRRLGIAPGPEYKRIFRKLLDAKLAGRVRTREDELAFVGKMRKGEE